ncbi:radical SAM protein [Geobacter pelophilus]|uniref:Radical SAM protein n=1 Tax=Geoanaerobacter pelophilus TaxID=60036 RepID=A0AAW4LAD4_9BACT|nr:radical SAM protein [Geoanaerobacter pelophilus]MBT0666560.1 radical SAM protein [Geoanaerobacter pelophilus]
MAALDFSRIFDLLGKIHTLLPSLFNSTRALPPLFVHIEVTHRCNVKCAMCYQDVKLSPQNELTLQEIKHIIDQLPKWCILSLTGGEPFLREDIASILEYGMKRGKCSLVTNGSLIKDSHIDMIVRNRLLLMAVSIDGMQETHDSIRRSPGLFDKAVEALGKIKEKKKELKTSFPLIDIKTVILKENLHQLTDILNLADSLSADFVTFSIPRSMDNIYSAPYRIDLQEICQTQPVYPVLGNDDLTVLTKQIEEIRKYKGKVKIRTYPEKMLNEVNLEKFYRQELTPQSFNSCFLPWSRMSISPHGDVFPCMSFLVGNVRNDSLAKLWNNDRFRAFRASLDKKSLSSFCFSCCHSECNESADCNSVNSPGRTGEH